MASFKEQPLARLTYLQWLSVAANRLTDLDGLVGPALETLILTGDASVICVYVKVTRDIWESVWQVTILRKRQVFTVAASPT